MIVFLIILGALVYGLIGVLSYKTLDHFDIWCDYDNTGIVWVGIFWPIMMPIVGIFIGGEYIFESIVHYYEKK